MIPTLYEFVTSEQLVTATSGIAATAAVTWNPAELIAAQSAVSVTQKFIAVPPSSLSTPAASRRATASKPPPVARRPTSTLA
jgi:hypothetical protein